MTGCSEFCLLGVDKIKRWVSRGWRQLCRNINSTVCNTTIWRLWSLRLLKLLSCVNCQVPFKSLSECSVLFHMVKSWSLNLPIHSYSVVFDCFRKCLRALSVTALPPHAAPGHIQKRGHNPLWPMAPCFYLHMLSPSPGCVCANTQTSGRTLTERPWNCLHSVS